MRTRRSPKNQERLWKALGAPREPKPKRTKLPTRAEARAKLFPREEVMPCPHGVVSGQCNDCFAEQLEKETEILKDIWDRWKQRRLTEREILEAILASLEKRKEA